MQPDIALAGPPLRERVEKPRGIPISSERKATEPKRVMIFTDGGASPNPGPGGWGAVLVCGKKVRKISGSEPYTTNNRMELTAAVTALRLLDRPCEVEIHTDSQYLRNGITRWVPGWLAHDWHRPNGRPVQNADLWQELLSQAARHRVTWHWIRGHSGNPFNELADSLATEARRQRPHGDRPSISQTLDEPPRAERPGSQHMADVSIYARGCALGAPGPGGYGAVVEMDDLETTISGGCPSATNNMMELWAVIAALRRLKQPSRVMVYTPSKYVIDGATRYLAQWERNGWRTREGRPVSNRELWQELAAVLGDHDVTWNHLSARAKARQSAQAFAHARREAEAVKAHT